MTGQLTNWAGNVTFHSRQLHRPASVGELRRLVASADRIRAIGTGHSFSPIADTRGEIVSLSGLPPVIEIDTGRGGVTISAGLRYGQLAPRLHAAGRALRNLASLPDVCIAGAVVTGTHGSGDTNGSLATAVSAIELVTAEGDISWLSRDGDPDRFAGMVVALGALGIITRMTLDTVPAFDARQDVYENLPVSELAAHFGEITSRAYSVSLFTDWRGPRLRQVWLKSTAGDTPPAAGWLGASRAARPRHPVPGKPPATCTQQLGVSGPWHERLPHFRTGCTPSAGAELQSEYLVAREHAVEAFRALDEMRDKLAPLTQITEIRTVAADELWLSPSYRRDCAGFHFTWISDARAVGSVLPEVEAALAPFGARPHWGKLFAVSPAALATRYPRLDDFRQLALDLDPAGKFRNEMLDRYVPVHA
ncbi:MAG TPA: FAD-binding protein [Actinobacteria bacterium]|nr:FAD-binding protein [Actinomycetota bacterium]